MAHPQFPIRNPIVPPSSIAKAPNGKIPTGELVQVPGPSGTHPFLVAPVARAWLALTAYARSAGFVMTHTGCYRPYDRQVALFLERHYEDDRGNKWWDGRRWSLKPGMANAAIPGTSPHGLACAIDVSLDGWGSQAKGVSEAWSRWAVANVPRFGFLWSLQSEPWHIQWVAGDSVPPALVDDGEPEEVPPPEEGEEADEMAKPWLIQSGPDVWITDWITRRGVAPEDINLWSLLGAVSTGPGGSPVPVTTTVLSRIRDVSPGAGGVAPSAGEVAAATVNLLAVRVAS